VLELDFEPFTASFPHPTLSKSIGNGMEFLTATFLQSSSMTRRACTHCMNFSEFTAIRGRSLSVNMFSLFSFFFFFLFFSHLKMYDFNYLTKVFGILLQSTMLNEKIQNVDALQYVLRKAEENLTIISPETPYAKFEHKFQEIGLVRGWGDTAERVLEMIQLLLDLLEALDPCTLEKFLGKIPMVFNVVTMSPHGYFA
jgi:sucrose synthase